MESSKFWVFSPLFYGLLVCLGKVLVLMTKLFPSRGLDVVQFKFFFFFCVCMDRMVVQDDKPPISSHFDQTRLVKKGFIICLKNTLFPCWGKWVITSG